MDFKDLAQMRRSHRKFTEEAVSKDDIKLILRSALMSPTSKGQRNWQFVVVEDQEKISDSALAGHRCVHAVSRTALQPTLPSARFFHFQKTSHASVSSASVIKQTSASLRMRTS